MNQSSNHEIAHTAVPQVSVLMPVYNAQKYISASIESILHQTFTDFEFIIINDGSTDASQAIIEDYARREPRIRLVSQSNQGIVNTLNNGIKLVRGNLIARMDADDISLKERFSRQVKFLQDHPDHVAVGCGLLYTDPDGIPFKTIRPPATHEEIDSRHLRGQGGGIMHPCVMMRTEAVLRAGGYRRAYQYAEDYDLFLRLAEIGKLANLPEILFYYRVHLGSITFEKHSDMYDRTRTAIKETCERRNIPMINLSDSPYRVSNRAGTTSFWAIQALLESRYAAAVHLAFKAILKYPVAWQPYMALALASLGPCGKTIYARLARC